MLAALEPLSGALTVCAPLIATSGSIVCHSYHCSPLQHMALYVWICPQNVDTAVISGMGLRNGATVTILYVLFGGHV
jgi:hypothetical protein